MNRANSHYIHEYTCLTKTPDKYNLRRSNEMLSKEQKMGLKKLIPIILLVIALILLVDTVRIGSVSKEYTYTNPFSGKATVRQRRYHGILGVPRIQYFSIILMSAAGIYLLTYKRN